MSRPLETSITLEIASPLPLEAVGGKKKNPSRKSKTVRRILYLGLSLIWMVISWTSPSPYLSQKHREPESRRVPRVGKDVTFVIFIHLFLAQTLPSTPPQAGELASAPFVARASSCCIHLSPSKLILDKGSGREECFRVFCGEGRRKATGDGFFEPEELKVLLRT